jgi:hypothetical protein
LKAIRREYQEQVVAEAEASVDEIRRCIERPTNLWKPKSQNDAV